MCAVLSVKTESGTIAVIETVKRGNAGQTTD